MVFFTSLPRFRLRLRPTVRLASGVPVWASPVQEKRLRVIWKGAGEQRASTLCAELEVGARPARCGMSATCGPPAGIAASGPPTTPLA